MTAELRHLLEGLLLVIGALLLIVNLLGTAPVFLALTGNVDDATRTNLARKVAINGFVLLLASIFIGGFVLQFFGLSIPVVQLAGGLVVCSLAWGLLREGEIAIDASTAESRQYRLVTQVVLRLSAFILLCIGVQIMWNGADALLGISGAPHRREP